MHVRRQAKERPSTKHRLVQQFRQFGLTRRVAAASGVGQILPQVGDQPRQVGRVKQRVGNRTGCRCKPTRRSDIYSPPPHLAGVLDQTRRPHRRAEKRGQVDEHHVIVKQHAVGVGVGRVQPMEMAAENMKILPPGDLLVLQRRLLFAARLSPAGVRGLAISRGT